MRVYGVAIFEVDKDEGVTKTDLRLAGLEILEDFQLDLEYIELIRSAEREFAKYLALNEDGYETKVLVCSYRRSRLVIVKLYRKGVRVSRVMLIGLKSGILKDVCPRLEAMGWRRVLMYEIKRIPRSIRNAY